MNAETLIKENHLLKEELVKLKEELVKMKDELDETKAHLKKYTAPSNMKKYYQNHKEEIIKKVKEYKEKNNYNPIVDAEKRKEYNKIAYQKKKEKELKKNEPDVLHPSTDDSNTMTNELTTNESNEYSEDDTYTNDSNTTNKKEDYSSQVSVVEDFPNSEPIIKKNKKDSPVSVVEDFPNSEPIIKKK